MNRQIKFRGKVYHYSHDCGWVYGTFHYELAGGLYDLITVLNDEKYEHESYNVASHTVGEWTGLKDITGKELYEGDILEATNRITNKISEVFMDVDNAVWAVRYNNTKKLLAEYLRYNNAIIIGNIHENPELLNHLMIK